jgi:pimeloyl-ACP methyl ester carboxylesterase
VSARCWDAQLTALGLAWHVLAVDLPGHGQSDPSDVSTVDGYAERVGALLDAEGLPSVVAVGHSLGAGVALALAVRRPRRVRGLVLLSACTRLPRRDMAVDRFLAWLPVPVRRLLFLSAARRLLFAPVAPAPAVALGMQELSACRPETVRRDVAAALGMDLSGPAAGLRLPVLVLCGGLDRLTPPALSAELTALIPGARLAVIDGAGHMLPLEAADAVNRQLDAFAASLAASSRTNAIRSLVRRVSAALRAWVRRYGAGGV